MNNLTDYGSNFQYVQHGLLIDTTFPENRLTWRAITAPAVHHLFYRRSVPGGILPTIDKRQATGLGGQRVIGHEAPKVQSRVVGFSTGKGRE
ncbi:MAG TPA: DUF2165 family protein [Methylomirabilota bacterium]|nr:DUF2165 family protein [Methylomirabilota bacterium]